MCVNLPWFFQNHPRRQISIHVTNMKSYLEYKILKTTELLISAKPNWWPIKRLVPSPRTFNRKDHGYKIHLSVTRSHNKSRLISWRNGFHRSEETVREQKVLRRGVNALSSSAEISARIRLVRMYVRTYVVSETSSCAKRAIESTRATLQADATKWVWNAQRFVKHERRCALPGPPQS